jgi:NADH dehydrogenase
VHRVVIVGGGFGGLYAARALNGAPVEVTLVDRRNYHLFQPLLYQVATGSLSPGEIAAPLRGVLRRQRNADVLMGEVVGLDLEHRRVRLDGGQELPYDSLIVAAGAGHAYFGHDEWEPLAPGLKSIEDALDIRRRILLAFERAERAEDAQERAALLTFVVVGGGPTGVELAGQLAEIRRDTLRGNFRHIDPASARVLVFDPADRLLGAFDAKLAEKARRALTDLGIEVRLGEAVTDVRPGVVETRTGDGTVSEVRAETVVWAAGVAASPLARLLGDAVGADVDRPGRLSVEADLTLPGHPEVFALGDMVAMPNPSSPQHLLPGVAPVAMQQGRHAAQTIVARLSGETAPRPFHYRDKGDLATIGRARAVAKIKWLRLSGLPAWILWVFVHLLYLVGFQNRLLVLIRWSFSYWSRGRGARLITGRPSNSAPYDGREAADTTSPEPPVRERHGVERTH